MEEGKTPTSHHDSLVVSVWKSGPVRSFDPPGHGPRPRPVFQIRKPQKTGLDRVDWSFAVFCGLKTGLGPVFGTNLYRY